MKKKNLDKLTKPELIKVAEASQKRIASLKRRIGKLETQLEWLSRQQPPPVVIKPGDLYGFQRVTDPPPKIFSEDS